MGGGVGRGLPLVSPVSLYSYLVTRHTGRAVRMGIENRLAECQEQVLAVVDFREVQLIDFSCADEVVAKLLLHAKTATGPPTFFLFKGLEGHHVDPVESVLKRQHLAAAAEGADGRPFLLGSVSRRTVGAWRAVNHLGRADSRQVAERLQTPASVAGQLLERLHRRRLLLLQGAEYVSLWRALTEAKAKRAD